MGGAPVYNRASTIATAIVPHTTMDIEQMEGLDGGGEFKETIDIVWHP